MCQPQIQSNLPGHYGETGRDIQKERLLDEQIFLKKCVNVNSFNPTWFWKIRKILVANIMSILLLFSVEHFVIVQEMYTIYLERHFFILMGSPSCFQLSSFRLTIYNVSTWKHCFETLSTKLKLSRPDLQFD